MTAPTSRPLAIAVLLAAGKAERMGWPKALLDAGGGTSFLGRLAATFNAAGARPLVVLGANAAEIRSRHPEFWWVDNPHWADGQWSSVQVGLRAALAAGAGVVWVHPVDAPLVTPQTVRAVAAALDGAPAAAPTCGGTRGHPVALTADAARAVLNCAEASSFAEALAHVALLEVATFDPGVTQNLNTPADYAQAFGHPPRLAVEGRLSTAQE